MADGEKGAKKGEGEGKSLLLSWRASLGTDGGNG